jgi:hypothetical protein
MTEIFLLILQLMMEILLLTLQAMMEVLLLTLQLMMYLSMNIDEVHTESRGKFMT